MVKIQANLRSTLSKIENIAPGSEKPINLLSAGLIPTYKETTMLDPEISSAPSVTGARIRHASLRGLFLKEVESRRRIAGSTSLL